MSSSQVKVGENILSKLSNAKVHEGNPGNQVDLEKLFKGRRVVLFGVPGAFTPGCSNTHLPGYVSGAEKIKGKGVDEIVCISVNDAFVMDAW
jgi:peroxiredoxin